MNKEDWPVAMPASGDLFAGHDRAASRDECLSWVCDVAELLGHLPPQDFGESRASVDSIRMTVRARRLLTRRPTMERVRSVAGPSWFEVLCNAGLIPDGGQQTARGVKVIANDGCVCLSLGGRLIDDLLSSEGLMHEREVPYPDSMMRCDWLIGGTYVEYFGLAGNPDYDARIREKQELTRRLGLRLLAIWPAETKDPSALRERLLDELKDAPRQAPTQLRRTPAAFDYLDFNARYRLRRARREQIVKESKARGEIVPPHLRPPGYRPRLPTA